MSHPGASANRRLGDLDAARRVWRETRSWLDSQPEANRGWRVPTLWLHRAVLEAQWGDREESRRAFDQAMELSQCGPEARCGLDDLNLMVSRAQYRALTDEPELALQALAWSLEFPMPVAWAAELPEWQSLRDDPRWQALAERLRAMEQG